MTDHRPDPVEVASVYVHAPFCARRCPYCDFAVTVDSRPDAAGWLRAIGTELARVLDQGLARLAVPLDSLYVGGGTPSLLGPAALSGLADLLGREVLGADDLEWTAEANPESLTDAVAAGWRDAGVTRVSLGSQSFQEPALRWMGRLHGADGAAEAVARARRAGFDNLSVDLIFGLPDEVERDWDTDLDRLLELDVPHVSLYGLTADAETPLGRSVARGGVTMPGDRRYAEEYLRAHERLAAAGYRAYEVSNFARPGFESRHNGAYWTGLPYLGLGNGAHSYLPPERFWNLRGWLAYASEAWTGSDAVAGREVVAGEAARLERCWLGLRTDRGLASTDFTTPAARDLADHWVRVGWARWDEDRLVSTPEGWLLLDRLAVELDAALAGPSRPGPGIDGPFPVRRSSSPERRGDTESTCESNRSSLS